MIQGGIVCKTIITVVQLRVGFEHKHNTAEQEGLVWSLTHNQNLDQGLLMAQYVVNKSRISQ